MKRFVVATDGSQGSEDALRYTFDLAAAADAIVDVVHVAPAREWFAMMGPAPAVKLPHVVAAADRKPLDRALVLAEELGVHANTRLLQGDPVDEVVAYADEVGADLVLVGSRGRGTVTSTLLGSVSLGILHETRRPVLIVHGTDVREDASAQTV